MPLTDVLLFPVLCGLALHLRTQPPIQKRRMVVSGTLVRIAGAVRVVVLDIVGPVGMMLAWLSPIALCLARDAWCERRIHEMYGWGHATVVLLQTGFWRSKARWRDGLGDPHLLRTALAQSRSLLRAAGERRARNCDSAWSLR